MKVAEDTLTPQQVLALAEAWHRQQMARAEKCLGTFWPEHREWIGAYLAEEVRQKLLARGWRPKRG